MKKVNIIILILISNYLNGQNFSKIYDYELNGQCKHYLVFARQEFIYVFGDYIDSARIAIRPFWAKYNYNGERVGFDSIWDNNFNTHLSFDQFMPYTFQNDSIIIFSAIRFFDSLSIGQDNLLKINLYSGKLINSIINNNKEMGFVRNINYNKIENKLIGVSSTNDGKSQVQVFELDSNFNKIKSLNLIIDANHAISPSIIKKYQGNYYLVGDCSISGKVRETKTFFMAVIDSFGTVINFIKLNPTVPIGGWLLNNIRIIERSDNDYIIAGSHLANNIPSPRDENLFAHPIRVNSKFDSIRWELKMYDKPNYTNPYQFYNGVISINNEREYIGYGDDLYDQSGSCVLYKFTENGDSLWYKRIIPGDGKKDSTGWVPTYMAAESPRGGFVVVGGYHDERRPRYSAIRSFIMYLDDDGCLVPDCNKVVSNKDIEDGYEAYFKIYPNPVVDQLKVLCNYSQQGRYNFWLINMQGVEVWSKNVSCNQGDQVFWSVDDISAGIYVLLISDKDNKVVQEIKLVKL